MQFISANSVFELFAAEAARASELRKEFVVVFVVFWAPPMELEVGERSKISATLSRASRIDL